MRNTKRSAEAAGKRPELTEEDFKRSRRFTSAEREVFRQAIERKLGVSRPPRIGRPPKKPDEKCVPISWRTPPDVMDWLNAQAHNAGVEKYQTFLSMLLKSLTRFEAVREKYGITLKLPNSEHSIVIASTGPFEDESKSRVKEGTFVYSWKRLKKSKRKSNVEVSKITADGVFVKVFGRIRVLDFDDFPVFRTAKIASVQHVMCERKRLQWPDLHVDLPLTSNKLRTEASLTAERWAD
ncbi:MAG: hypothetical protein HY077_03500 [Elusimicrobia bacterium]|nr:hypothetical protein [Elusimicrobiota bacterium]